MKDILEPNDIDTTTIEGRMLMASIAKLTTESQMDKTIEEVIEQLRDLVTVMYEVSNAE